MGQQLSDIAVERGRQAGEHVEQPGMGFMAIGLGGGEQAHDRGGTAPGRFRADEEPVLAFMESFP